MTRNDRDIGRMACPIGITPLHPAEFVIFRIGQKTIMTNLKHDSPYTNFNFLVSLAAESGGEAVAGFSEVSGLNSEVTVAEYRKGGASETHAQKVPAMHKTGDVTLKRGLINSDILWDWVNESRTGKLEAARKQVVIELIDEAKEATVVTWTLTNAMPLKWTGPTLSAKGGSEVVAEELVLSVEYITQS